MSVIHVKKMRLLICPENAEKIEAALLEVNNDSKYYTFTKFEQIEAVAAQAEREVLALLPARYAIGAQYRATSGGSVSPAYKYQRRVTNLHIRRTRKGWAIILLKSILIFNSTGNRLGLTVKQSNRAIDIYTKNYEIMNEIVWPMKYKRRNLNTK